MTTPPPLLTTRDVADRLGISTSSVRRHWREGTLPGYRLPGGAARFHASEIDAWITSHQAQSKLRASGQRDARSRAA